MIFPFNNVWTEKHSSYSGNSNEKLSDSGRYLRERIVPTSERYKKLEERFVPTSERSVPTRARHEKLSYSIEFDVV